MKKWLALPVVSLGLGGCALTLSLSPQIPIVNIGNRAPLKVIVIVPQESRDLNQAKTLPSGICVPLHTNPAPHGQIFLETVQGIMEQYFDQVIMLDTPPASSDAQLIVEATLTGIGVKTACDYSPAFYAEAQGTFRIIDSQGRETWRDPHTSARAQEAMPTATVAPYHTIMPKAMAALVSYWAADLAMTPVVRNAQSQRSSKPAAGSVDEPWWKESGSDGGKN